MSEGSWIALGVAAGGIAYLVGRYWYRRWLAGKLADDLLKDVVKGKDAFRR